MSRRAESSGTDAGGLLPWLVLALLPLYAVLGEFVWRGHRLIAVAFFYGCAVLFIAALRHWRAAAGRAGAQHAVEEQRKGGRQRAAGLLAAAVFAAGYFGLLELLFGLGAGVLGQSIRLPLDPDVYFYALGLLLWAGAYMFMRRSAPGQLDYYLAWRWRPADPFIALGLGALTWAGLSLYLRFNAGAHPPMDIFGFAAGTLAPWAYLALGLVFTTANAFLEELWFRGLLLPGLGALLRPWPAALLCGLIFGLTHWFGTPRGVAGLLLAGSWSVLLSYWTLARRSLWPALSVHLLADFLIWLRTN